MTKNKKGFTIIEVVLVLAIAGLIFLMVFIALPALQRSQRNTQRDDDLSRFLTAANDYQTNNNGKTPFYKSSNANAGVDKNFVKRYIDSTCKSYTSNGYQCGESSNEFRDPDGTNYNMVGNTKISANTTYNWTWENNKHTIRAVVNATCGDEGQALKGTGDRQYAMFYVLEGGAISCNDNH